MTLKIYRQKRDFKKTPEPSGKTSTTKKIKNLYIIQKHAASHLHYDFRIELNGVLLSWAVPKGPSLDPSVKRLAMHVEDHPLEYGSFEGIIPKGQYGGGTVMLWDKGTWIPEDAHPAEAYQKGNLTFELRAKKLKGRWKLIRINKNDKTWLLMKLNDKYAKSMKQFDVTEEEPNSVKSNQSIDDIAKNYKKIWGKQGLIKKPKMPKKKLSLDLPTSSIPTQVYPELATLVDEPPTGNNWLHEIKYDGYRLIAYKIGKKVKLMTRNQNDWTSKFKNIANAISKLPINNLILDGEVVVLDEKNKSNFQLLQNSIKTGDEQFIYYIFDLIYYENYNLENVALLERKNILKKILIANSILRYSDHIIGSGPAIFKRACKLGLEGIVSKETNSPYQQKRTRSWLKTKCIKRQEFVIGGFQPSERRDYFRSLMLGTYNKKNELIYSGNVGTGFTATSLKNIYQKLSKLITNQMPFKQKPPLSKTAKWVKPTLVAEVEFTEWTNDGTLRHPSFKGLRTDKPAKKIGREIVMPIKKVLSPKKNSFHLTSPDKILYSEGKITKRDLAEYYEAIHEWILPYITNRPLTLVRCPTTYHECFFQKHISNKLPTGMHKIKIKEKSGSDDYLYIDNVEGLMDLVQMSALEIHPWGSTINDLEYPDFITFDLDPAPELSWKKVVAAAFKIKEILLKAKLKSFVKTTGGKGLHVVVPIKPEYDWDTIKTFSKTVVDYLVLNSPSEYIGTMSKVSRKNKIFVDYLRNARGATAIAPYSTRARKFAPVSTPLAWDELTDNFNDTFFTIKTLPARLDALKKDPWADFFKRRQSLKLNKLK